MTTWQITVGAGAAQSAESLGVSIAGLQLRNQAVSTLTLKRLVDFDEATDVFTYGTSIILSRLDVATTTVVFRGKVTSNPRSGTQESETQDVVVSDVWDELSRTIYQELWGVAPVAEVPTKKFMPRAILGLNPAGNSIATGAQLSLFLAYAADTAGLAVQAGTVPVGQTLWPSQTENKTIAELIREIMKFHPTWVVSIDYKTSPVTLNIIDQASATAINYPVDGSGDVESFNVRPVSERVPDAVVITYETSSTVDGQTYRSLNVDGAPSVVPPGPNVLSAVIPLQGAAVTTQSQPIEVRTMPTSQEEAKAWMKLKFPSIADVPDAAYNVVAYQRTLIPLGAQPDPPVNAEAPRVEVLDFNELPNELVRGTVADWMRRKVGNVEVLIQLQPTPAAIAAAPPGSPEADLLKKLPIGPQKIITTCTNAITKVYRGTASFTPAENAPVGLAASIYAALSTTQHEGQVNLANQEIPVAPILGKKVNLTGGRAEWATMGAMVTEVDYKIETGTTEIFFGPPKYLSPQDWIEMQRALRTRYPTWTTNRDSDEPAQDGEEVTGGYDTPRTETLPGRGDEPTILTLEGSRGITIEEGAVEAQKKRIIGMPAGTHGNVMYFSQPDPLVPGVWIALANPSSGLHVLTHNGTLPSWTATHECP